jgi:hypothetical protein
MRSTILTQSIVLLYKVLYNGNCSGRESIKRSKIKSTLAWTTNQHNEGDIKWNYKSRITLSA